MKTRLETFLRRKSAYGPLGLGVAFLGLLVLVSCGFGAVLGGLLGLQHAALDQPLDPLMAELGSVFSLWLPLASAGGLLALVGGLSLHADREVGRRLAQAACLWGLAWSVGYAIALGPYLDLFVQEAIGRDLAAFAGPLRAFTVIARLSVFTVVPPPALALLWLLRERKC